MEYVIVRTGDSNRTAHRVSLLSPAEVDALIDRRAAILDGNIQPGACASKLCNRVRIREKSARVAE